MDEQDQIEAGYKQAAEGAQKLAEAIDLLLPALIQIAAAKGQTTKELAQKAEGALIAFEEHRGQKLNRRAYMASKKRLDAVADGAALHQARAAGVAR